MAEPTLPRRGLADQDRSDAERAEAVDPATPPERLAELMEFHADAVLQNPSLSLLLMERPDFWSSVSHNARNDLARSDACPLSFASWLLHANTPDTSLTYLLWNRAVPMAMRRAAYLKRSTRDLLQFWTDERPILAEVLSPTELSLLERGGGLSDPDAPPMTEDEFEHLAALCDLGLELAMNHPCCPGAVLDRLSETGAVPAAVVLSHPNCDPERLALALASPDVTLRRHAALNPTLSAAQFEQAAQDPAVRADMAMNRALPPEWVEVFLHDPNPLVRMRLADNRSLSPESQKVLATDPYAPTRSHLLQNPSVTAEARALAEALQPPRR
jgi:hypothetical protein